MQCVLSIIDADQILLLEHGEIAGIDTHPFFISGGAGVYCVAYIVHLRSGNTP
ncbi:MAG: hypothetical protein FWF77_05440 [Defluviitaleaceae bacterium]|nr:hypothetical protein [Defluviitaleaceae bacterium]